MFQVLILYLFFLYRGFTQKCADDQIYYYQQCVNKTCIDNNVVNLKTIDEMNLTQTIEEDQENYKIILTLNDPDFFLGPKSCLTYGIYQNQFPVPSSEDAQFYQKANDSLSFTTSLVQLNQFDKITISFSKLDVQNKCFNQTDSNQYKYTCSFLFTIEINSQPLLIYFFDTKFSANKSFGNDPNPEQKRGIKHGLQNSSFTFGSSNQYTPYAQSLKNSVITKSVNSALYFCLDENCAQTDENLINLGITLYLNKLFYIVHEIVDEQFKNLYITETKVKFQSPDLSITLSKGDSAIQKINEKAGRTIVQLRVPVFGNNILIIFTGVLSLISDSSRKLSQNSIEQDLQYHRFLQNDTDQTKNLVSQMLKVNSIAPFVLTQFNQTTFTNSTSNQTSTNLFSVNQTNTEQTQCINYSTNPIQGIKTVLRDVSWTFGIILRTTLGSILFLYTLQIFI